MAGSSLIAFKDSFFWLMKVSGSSMEPSLKNGDILLVRKADFPLWRRWLRSSPRTDDDSFWKEDPNDKSKPSMRDRRVREYEYQQSLERHRSGFPYVYPPTPLRGQIVSYRSPNNYPYELCIKRVIAVSGQVVATKEGLKDVGINRIWVEGDNHDNSRDSRDYGALNQHLVTGVAEYCVWPPWRMGKVRSHVDDRRSCWL